MREFIEFNNPTAARRQATFVIRAKALPPELRLSFMLSKIETARDLTSSITGVVSAKGGHGSEQGRGSSDKHWARWLDRIEDEIEETSQRVLEWAGCWVENFGRWLEHKPPHSCHLQAPYGVLPAVYTALPSTNVTINGVLLPPYGAAGMLFTVENRGSLPVGARYTFHVQQLVDEKVVGGSAYVVRIAGDRQPVVIPAVGEEDLGWVPSYAESQIDARETSLGKQ